MRPPRPAIIGLLLILALPAVSTAAPADDDTAQRALAWLASRQNAAGSWTAVEPAYVVEAAAAAGRDIRTWPTPERSAWDALRIVPCTPRATPADQRDCDYKSMQRVVHAAGVAGYDPRDIHGIDGVARVREGFVGGQFGDPTFINDDIWAILALRAAGVPADDPQIRAGVENIRSARVADGGWSHRVVATASDTDMTAMALVALAAAGERVGEDTAARGSLMSRRNADGGFRNGPIGVNVQSTVWGLHAMSALGIERDTLSLEWLSGQKASDASFGGEWRTSEAIIPLAGARFPLPGFHPLTPPSPPAHAREDVALQVSAPFTTATWTLEGVALEGRVVTFRPQATGEYRYHIHARGPSVNAHAEGVIHALSARPVLPAFPANVTLERHANLTLDLRNATDPDGQIVAFEVDWGDGNSTSTLTHAYPTPGNWTIRVRARDDAGVWSHPARLVAAVTNRAPIFPALPGHVVTDRLATLSLDITATDPDGDGVSIHWSMGPHSGEGTPQLRPDTLGNHTLLITARDSYGAQTSTTTIVEVVNVAPRVAIEDAEKATANATDADGPAPTLSWFVDDAPSTPPFSWTPGMHVVRVVAVDADGASASASTTILIAEPDAAPPAPPPEIIALDAILVDGVLHVTFDISPLDAQARLRWASDMGWGEVAVASPVEIPIPRATWAEVTLVVEQDGLETTRESGRVRAPAPVVAPAQTRESETPEVIVEAPAATPTPSAEPLRTQQDERRGAALEPASVRQMEPRQETPLPLWPLLAGLLVAMLGTRRGQV